MLCTLVQHFDSHYGVHAIQMVFEDFGFRSLCVCPAPLLSLQHAKATAQHNAANQAGCALVLDAGFSFTHAVPIFSDMVLDTGVRRQNLGGKVLTNYLKELVSYRQVPAVCSPAVCKLQRADPASLAKLRCCCIRSVVHIGAST